MHGGVTALGETPGDYDKHFILTADIDLDPKLPGRKVFDKAVIAADTDSVKPDFQGTPFTGVFDGNGHRISHLTIKGASYLGLLGQLASGVEVKDLGVVDANVTGSGNYVGGLVAYNYGNVTQCYSTGAVSGDTVGGLVGNNAGQVTQCYSTGSISGTDYVGGLVGDNSFGIVSHSYSTGAVTGDKYVGGLVGASCHGVTGGSICGVVTDCFWDTQTSGQAESDGGTGLTTSEMKRAITFTSWADDGAWIMDEERDYPRLWWESTPGRPITRVYYYGGGKGSQSGPYLIYSAEQLNMIGLISCDLDKHFRLMADLDLSGFDGKDGRSAFRIIGLAEEWGIVENGSQGLLGTAFTGVFDGNGHTISHLTVKTSGYGGLFGRLEGEVRNLGVIDVNVTGGSLVGGLTAWNSGALAHCYSTGVVSGSYYSVGGLVGENDGEVTQCYSTGAVTGKDHVGGLVGANYYGPVTQCYSTGAVSGHEYVGGLVGVNGGWATVTASFWDIQTSGQTTSAGGTGKTTAEMRAAKTFLDGAWDFVGETKNGTADIWWILEGKDYPRLSWELTEKKLAVAAGQ